VSLKSELLRKDSWVNQFFKTEIPNITSFTKRVGPSVKALPLKVPLGAHRQATLVGTALDYRVRLHLGADVGQSDVLNLGVLKMRGTGSGFGPAIDSAWADWAAHLLHETPVGDELMLSQASIVLAWLDAGFRSGGRWGDGMKLVAESLEHHKTLSWPHFVSSVDQDLANEVAALYDIAKDHLPTGLTICGPEFAGSRSVGGADADLICDGCLYDIKTTVNPRKKFVEHLRQLIGYALLDWYDEHALDGVSIYYARQAASMTWSLPELIEECAGGELADLGSLRGRFRTLAATGS